MPEGGLSSASIQVGFGKNNKPYFKFRDDSRDYEYYDFDKEGKQIGKRDAGIEMGIDEDDTPYLYVFSENEHKRLQYVEIKAGPLPGSRLRAYNGISSFDPADQVTGIVNLTANGGSGEIVITSLDRDRLNPGIKLRS